MNEFYFEIDHDFSFSDWYKKAENQKHFPDYFGGNLDAFYDLMTETVQDVTIKVVSKGKMGQKGRKLVKVIKALARENDHICLIMEEAKDTY